MSKHRADDADKGIVNSRKYKTKGRSTILDELIGHQIRRFRHKRNLSQADLGRIVGVTYQQIQKYETAQNRIAASTLLVVSLETGQSLEYFVSTAKAYLEEEK